MLTEIFAIIAPIFICAALGYGWARSGTPFESQFVSRLVMNIGAPCLIVGTLGKVDMPASHFIETVTAAVLVMVITGLLAIVLCRVMGLSQRAYLTSLVFPNTGNMGLPLSFFAFGEEGLAVALGLFLVKSLAHFSIGVALVSGSSNWRDSLRSPIVAAGLLTAVLIFTGWQLPQWLQNTVSLLGDFSIPLMLITLGVSLAQLRVRDFTLSCGLGVARLLIGFGAGFAVAELLSLEGAMRGVVIIQSTMPAAVFNYLLAQRYGQSPEAVAGLVVASTALSFVTLPTLLWFVL